MNNAPQICGKPIARAQGSDDKDHEKWIEKT